MFNNASVYPGYATLNDQKQINSYFSFPLLLKKFSLCTSGLGILGVYTHIETEYKGRTVSCSMCNWCQKAEFMNTNPGKIIFRNYMSANFSGCTQFLKQQ